MRRRLKNAAWVLISQMLLIALAIAWLIHMVLIAIYGSINFVEENPFILYGEITISALVAIYAIVVLITQIRRLGERRSSDRRSGNTGFNGTLAPNTGRRASDFQQNDTDEVVRRR